ncbi:MAG: carboxypeptidase M32, partial [Rhodospirillaceae bacterium]|nr:carboxypeptidase M32 [Rhodospirillaceae bacterium]
MTGAYSRLEVLFGRIAALEGAMSLLQWDASVMMPPGAGPARGGQLAGLGRLRRDLLAEDETADLLDAAAGEALDDWQSANLRAMRRERVHAVAAPGDLLEARTKAEIACEGLWREARQSGDFAAVCPALEGLVALVQESAVAKGEALGCTPYEGLLDENDPDRRAAEVDRLFGELSEFLPDFVDRVIARQDSRPAPADPAGSFPVAQQRALARDLMTAVGFDFARGRLDESAHPFCGGVPDDVRLTTRFDKSRYDFATMAVLHESGHGMYEQGLPAAWRGQPVGQAAGMTVHESQSLCVEMQASRSAPFQGWLAGRLRAVFGEDPAWGAEDVHRRAIRVRRSTIRVEADEVTYPLHVILRYRLERAMLAGDLVPADLPGAWRDGMTALLGVAPEDDRDGCLQDIHWYFGAWGYFPTYTLGALA